MITSLTISMTLAMIINLGSLAMESPSEIPTELLMELGVDTPVRRMSTLINHPLKIIDMKMVCLIAPRPCGLP